jgi:hypothetical protein
MMSSTSQERWRDLPAMSQLTLDGITTLTNDVKYFPGTMARFTGYEPEEIVGGVENRIDVRFRMLEHVCKMNIK